jgi:hypothetical protein
MSPQGDIIKVARHDKHDKRPVCTGPGEMTLAVQNNHIPSTVEIVTPLSRAEAI